MNSKIAHLSFYCLSAQLAFRIWCVIMWWKWVNTANTHWCRNPSWMFSQRCSLKGTSWEYKEPGPTKRAVSASDLQNTSDLRPDYPGTGQPASTSRVDVWEFITFPKTFSGVGFAPGSYKCSCRWTDISRLHTEIKQDHLLKRLCPLWNHDVRYGGPHHQTFSSWLTGCSHKSFTRQV